jgi:hypothetical protein
MTEREQFEAWYLRRYGEVDFSLYSDGRYKDRTIDCMWQAWQARAIIAQPVPTLNNFCPRCGKRDAADLIHTCTPPDTPVPAVHAQEPMYWQTRRLYSDKTYGAWCDCSKSNAEQLGVNNNILVRALYTAPPDAQAIRDAAHQAAVNDCCEIAELLGHGDFARVMRNLIGKPTQPGTPK